MSLTITNIDQYSIALRDADFKEDLLKFTGADTFKKGTILARQLVSTTVTPAADGGNTGDGTVTLATVVEGPIVPLVGAYVLECVAAAANGGTFKLIDPNGAQVASDLVMSAGAGAATVFEVAGLKFTVTDGAADFIVGDKFTLTVAADGDLVPYAVAGAGGAQIPVAVLTYEVSATGAVDKPVRVLVRGEVNKNRLIIDADGDASNVDNVVIGKLQDVGIIATDVTQRSVLDNQ